jgi:hypothetical protein
MAAEDEFDYLFDPNDESDRIFQKFRKYYSVQTDDFREALLKMNVSTPKSILEASFQPRKEMISKNVIVKTSIQEESEKYRNENLRKVINTSTNLEEESEKYRNDMLRRIDTKKSDILSSSAAYRDGMLSKITPSTSDVQSESVVPRDGMLSKITPSTSDIESESVEYRDGMLSKIVPSTSDVESESVAPRDGMLSKNTPSVSDVQSESVAPRDGMLSKNVPKTSDIESESVAPRDGMLSKIVPSTSDVESESVAPRDGMLSKNTPSVSDIESESVAPRDGMLSKIVPSTSDVQSESVAPRDGMLSKIVPSTSDIESESVAPRDGMLSKNTPSVSDIESESVAPRDGMLSKITPSTSDIESESVEYRDGMLSKIVPSTSDIESESVAPRDGMLSKIVPSTSDIESESVAPRDGMLSKITPSTSDIESESVEYREDDLQNNVPSNSDIESASVEYREDDLQNNVPSNSDIESDSVEYREDDLQNNVPSNSDIESDSVEYREDDLTYNVPSTSDIETDSIPFRTEDLTNNVPSESDIETDSIPFRTEDLTNNVPNTSDIETDSVTHRLDDLTNNVPSESDIETDSIPFRTEDLTNNVPSFSNIEDDSESHRNDDLSNNTPSHSDILTDSAPYRSAMLTKNGNLGLIGVNIQGLGTSAFIGVSRNYTLGILVRELLQTRNKYTPRNPYSTSGADSQIEKGNYLGYFNKTVAEEIDEQLKRGDEDFKRPPTKTYPTQDSLKYFTLNGYFEEDTKGEMNKVFGAGNRMQNIFDNKPSSIKNLMKSITDRTPDEAPLAANYNKNSKEFLIGGKNADGSTPGKARKRYSIDNPYFSGTDVKKAGKLIFAITNYAIPETSDFRTMFFPPYIQSFQENANANWNTHDFLGRPEPVYTYNNSTRGGSITFFVLTDYAQNVEIGTNWSDESLGKIVFNATESTPFIDAEKSNELGDVNHFTDRYRKNNEFVTDKAKISSEIKKQDDARTVLQEEKASVEAIDPKSNEFQQIKGGHPSGIFGVVWGLDRAIREHTIEIARLTDNLRTLESSDEFSPNFDNDFYSESSADNKNTVASALGKYNDGFFHDVERLKTMKRGLHYQPAFFSGDKVDFDRKMTFLQRTTRPRGIQLSDQQGFSFTRPPVCHIKLGDWLNNDCIITDVSIDYTDSMWALEENDVQPMWASVTINFNIIGQWSNRGGGRPLLADDDSGYYNKRVSKYSVEAGDITAKFISNS